MTYPHQPPVIYVQRPPSNGVAITSMIMGIIAILIAPWALIPIVGIVVVLFAIIPTLLAIFFGHGGLRSSKALGGTGNGSAVAGLVMGYLSLLLCIVPVFGLIAVLAASGTPSS